MDEHGHEFVGYFGTPALATKKLIDFEGFKGNVWEPACGKGEISKVFIDKGFEVHSSDLLDLGFGMTGVDFLNSNSLFSVAHERYDNIVTNPPRESAAEFVKMAKEFSNYKIAMLLKTTFLETVSRQELFRDPVFPLKKIYQFVRRLVFEGVSNDKKWKGGMGSFAWFVWERGYKGNPEIDWLE